MCVCVYILHFLCYIIMRWQNGTCNNLVDMDAEDIFILGTDFVL